MTCRRAYDLDLAELLLEPQDDRFAEFRAHSLGCADCSAEVAAWTALEAALAPEHPDEESLLAFVEPGTGLTAERRLAIAGHLKTCLSCADELRALGRADAIRTAAAEPAADAALPSGIARTREPATGDPARRAPAQYPSATRARRSALTTVRRVLWHPALPYAALLALLLLPTLRAQRHELQAPPRAEKVAAPATAAAPVQPPAAAAPSAPLAQPAPAAVPPAAPMPQELADEQRSAALRAASERDRLERRAATAPAVKSAPSSQGAADDASPAFKKQALAEAPAAAARGSDVAAAGGAAGALEAPGTSGAPGASAPSGARQARSAANAEGARGAADVGRAAGAGGAAMHLSAAREDGMRRLTIALDAAARHADSLEVRVRDASGAHELRQRISVAPGTSAVEIELPAPWFDAPSYAIEVWAGGTVVASGSIAAR